MVDASVPQSRRRGGSAAVHPPPISSLGTRGGNNNGGGDPQPRRPRPTFRAVSIAVQVAALIAATVLVAVSTRIVRIQSSSSSSSPSPSSSSLDKQKTKRTSHETNIKKNYKRTINPSQDPAQVNKMIIYYASTLLLTRRYAECGKVIEMGLMLSEVHI
jgi:hypothetical protein